MADTKTDDDAFALSVHVSSIEKPSDYKKDTNFICKITIETTHGKWNLNRSFKDFEIFHANLIINDAFRGLNFPKIPARKGSVPSIDDYLASKQNEYSTYLSEILHRSILLGHKDILDFVQAPEKVRRAAKNIAQIENIPVKSGQMKKEGEKWKGYRSRFFVLLPNYLLQYYETADAYQIGIQPKGSIDLTLATKILVYDKTSNPFSMGIKTPSRIWKLQCETESDRDEWVQSLRNLLQNPQYSGYINDFHNNSNNKHSNKKMVAPKKDNNQNNEKMEQELEAQSIAMEEQDKQITELQNRMQSLMNKQNMETEKLREEISVEYKQQLDMQRETMVKWKEKIQELTQELVNIEQERKDADKEYNDKISELNKLNEQQKQSISEKNEIIDKTQNDLNDLNTAIIKLQKEAKGRAKKMYSISDVLSKIQGDSVNKLKYNKSGKKYVVFISKINHLFYYDHGDKNKNEQKYIIVKDIIINNNSITKQMNKPWFQIVGEKRIAVFSTDSKEINQKWINAIKESLGKNNDDNDEKKQDE